MTKTQLSAHIKASVEKLGSTTEPVTYYTITEDIFTLMYKLPFPANCIEQRLNVIGFWKDHVYKMGNHMEFRLREKEKHAPYTGQLGNQLNPLDEKLLLGVIDKLIFYSLLPEKASDN